MDPITFYNGDFIEFERAISREWLVTNGRGGFASSTVCGANTRRYHGLLVAALRPPVERVVLVSKIDEEVCFRDQTYPLATNEFADGTVSPLGFHYLQEFFLDRRIPVWRFAVSDALIEKRVWMKHGEGNITFVRYQLLRASVPLTLKLRPLVIYRDYHCQHRGEQSFEVTSEQRGFLIKAYPEAVPYVVEVNRGEFVGEPNWYWNFRHREEASRGLDDQEDLYSPGTFQVTLRPGEEVTVSCAVTDTLSAKPRFRKNELEMELERQQKLLVKIPQVTPRLIKELTLAADQFIVERNFDRKQVGKSIIAGYHWFSDWTRDTMLSLPGLTLATGRPQIAKEILQTYARYLSEGMLPNRFIDQGEEPEYNSVDAALLYVYAIYSYVQSTGDYSLARELRDAVQEIIHWYRQGTRFQIHVDPGDQLLFAGVTGKQLTWMDAKVGDWVVTPRIGKPVEINALWYNALMSTAQLEKSLGKNKSATEFAKQGALVNASFQERFWNKEGGYFFDVVDSEGDGRRFDDESFRPNQLIATGIPFELCSAAQTKAVVDRALSLLFTRYGLRTLDPTSIHYRTIYAGDQTQRDGSYHQGTVWPWLLGFFVASHLRVYQNPEQAWGYVAGLTGHLFDAGLGTISEIFDAEPPHRARGCIAQAWSVGEVLRAWNLVQIFQSGKRKGKKGK